MLNVLVADDDDNIRGIIDHYLKKQKYNVVEAENGRDALDLALEKQFDMVILDILMPEMDGYDVCREIRKVSNVPIIMLTASGDELDRVLGLELGADDYIIKPFSPRELVARIKAILRRVEPSSNENVKEQSYTYDYGEFKIDVDRREVIYKGEKVTLRPKEFDLLVQLAKTPGNVYTRETLLEHVWGYDFLGDIRIVDAHVKKIRNKFKTTGCDVLRTVWGVGYKFEV
ncbi:response regulator transcription factor [Halalkalibacter alkaliphilus]|uniref:Response regulator transcription factor n=1 Tax=Halalkalibacter alkaliphilus TaxID=2917993 RepID=A0A9X2CNL7_9BACI|nr:response regulator transcription factor [Halalkalibacter alkaliphilus]MCL7746803.1 response regulator transcription factor [Halalkalibacter alkaliphilus]